MKEIEELLIEKLTSDSKWDDLRAQLVGPSTRRTEMNEPREELQAALDREDEVIDEMAELERRLILAAHHIIANLSGLKKPQLQEALGWLQQFSKWGIHLNEEEE